MLPLLAYSEVGAHNTDKSAFVIYDGLVYDITGFLRFHPGGKSILMSNLGTDITETLDSVHEAYVSRLLQTAKHRNQYHIVLVGRLAGGPNGARHRIGLHEYQSRREYLRPDPMAATLRREVFAHLREAGVPLTKPPTNSILLLVFFYVLYGLAVYQAFIHGSILWCLLLGPIATFMAVNLSHTAMHGGLGDSPAINLLARVFWDIGGYSARGWDVEHQAHHQAPHTSIDVQTAGGSAMRFFQHQEFKWFHKYQMYYMWPALVLYSPNSWVMHSYNTLFKYTCVPMKEKVLHVVAKSVGFVLPLAASFQIHGAATAFTYLLVFAVSMSYASLFLLFIQHEDSYLPDDDTEPWSVRQVATSASWHTNALLQWLLGYFNYHTEHHLFPALNPALYPRLQPIVRSVCRRYDVRYKYISYGELVRSQLRAWSKFARGI
jgi:linoleoyl-CoA desaturase